MQGSSQQKDTGELEVLWISVGLFLLVLAIFVMFRTQILSAILWIKYHELKLISYFIVNQDFQGLAAWTDSQNPNRISFATLGLLSNEIGNTIKYPCIAVCTVFAVVIWVKHPESGFRDSESMETLSQKVKKTFPAINIVSGLDLAKTPIDEGPWAMGMTPIEFARHHKLIHRDPRTEKIVFDAFRTKIIFTEQLGRPWQGVDALQDHEKALFAMFSAFVNYKRDEAEAKMEDIARNITPRTLKTGKINFDTHAMLKKYAHTKPVEAVTKRHGYVNTIFIELLTEARKSGIVLNSLYLWLKPIDRKLWYVLNNVGRRAVFSEAGSAHAHWLAEKRLGFPIAQPMIDEAILALEEAVHSRIIKDL